MALHKQYGHLDGVGSPVGVTTPHYIGQIYFDTSVRYIYRSVGTTNDDWELYGAGPNLLDHGLDDHFDVPPLPSDGSFVLEDIDGGLQWTNFIGIKSHSLFWRESPTFNGGLSLLGWYIESDLAVALTSASPVTATVPAYNSHYVLNVSNTAGLPFTIRASGKTVNEVTGALTDEYEDISITVNGYYQSIKSFVTAAQFTIIENSKSCDLDIYTTTYWDRGNKDYTITGCRFEWTPNQNNWDVHVQIVKVMDSGEPYIIDSFDFHSTDTVARAADAYSGKYKRLDYNVPIGASSCEGLVIKIIDQQGIGSFMMEVKFDAV